MAIYRIYPEKDTTIWSEPNISDIYGNAGLDEILEIGTYKDINDTHRVQRSMIQFYTSQIQSTLDSKVTGQWTGSLHLSLAEAGSLPQDYVIHALAVSSSWTTGVGKRDDLPLNKSGCSWKFRGAQQDPWNALGGDYISSSLAFVSKSVKLSQDLDINVTDIVNSHYSSSYSNAGIMLKTCSY